MHGKRTVVGALALVTLMLSTAATAQPPLPHENHYKVYRTLPIPIPRDVGLRDQFGQITVIDPVFDRFSTPAEKHHAGAIWPMVDPLVHLDWWRIFYPQPLRTVIVRDQFGQSPWVVKDARYLLLPSRKNLTGPGAPPPIWNHYLCYEVVTGPIVEQPVLLIDQFGGVQVQVRYAKLLCNPVEKTEFTPSGPVVYPIIDATAHLSCYEILNTVPYGQPITALDQFGFWQTQVLQNDCLCVPALKDHPLPSKPSTWGKIKSLYRG
jgi:hypothetical protein